MFACAFNTNIDHIVEVAGSSVERACRSLASCDALEDETVGAQCIKDETDVLAALMYCMRTGTGREVLMDDYAPVANLKLSGTDRLGGNAANTAGGLSVLGCTSILNVAAPSTRQMALIPNERLSVPLDEPSDVELVHTVLEFRQGDVLRVGEKSVRAKESDRLILTYDPLNTMMVVNDAFERTLLEGLGEVSAVLASGLHLIRKTHDGRRSIALLKEIYGARPELKVHVELGSPVNLEAMMDTVRSLRGVLFSISMNEHEAMEIFGGGWSEQHTRERMHRFAEHMDVHTLCIHSTHVVYCISREPSLAVRAAELGARCAGLLALHGRLVAQRPDIALPWSAAGVRSISKLSTLSWDEHSEVFVPAHRVEKVATTTGLGDAFTAGFLSVLGSA